MTKYLRETELKEEKFILTHGFRGVYLGSTNLNAFKTMVRQIMVVGVCDKRNCSSQGGQDEERERWEEELVPIDSLRPPHTTTHLFQPISSRIFSFIS